MKYPWRMALFLIGALGLLGLQVVVARGLPGGDRETDYAKLINALTVPRRHVTDAVTEVNFDMRGFDTLGEEFILFVSVMGALVLLREVHPDEDSPSAAPGERVVRPSEAVRAWTLLSVGPTVIYGVYVVSHGQLTPGGGFQGGVVLATAPLLVYLTENFEVFKRVTSHWLVELSEAVGAAGFAFIGFFGCGAGHEFLTDVLPLGETKSLLSGGTVPLISFTVGLEVAAGFTLLLYGFLQKTVHDSGGGR